MPCPHYDIKIVQRSKRQSAVAAAAYQSGDQLFSEYDQRQKSYSEKQGIVHTEILLPENAPPGYADRNTLWNTVEAVENQWNSQLARRFIMALPRELSREEQIRLMREYCQAQFVSKGMIADFAIHDMGDGNPHAHILLTLRPMDEQGHWLPKCRKEYVLDEHGQRIKMKNGEWKSRRVNTVDWNEQKYGEIWRHEWEVIQNRYLEAAGRQERVDLRSFERQNNPHAPQVHLGPSASAMERRGIQTNLGNLNRDIVSANRLFDSIRRVIRDLKNWLADLSEKIGEQTAQKPEEQNLAEVLSTYMTLRHDGRSDWSKAGQTKAQVNDLKKMSAAIIFLQSHDITTVQKLGAHLDEARATANSLRNQIRSNDRRSSTIDAIIEAAAVVRELKPLHDQYMKIGWKSKKEKFSGEHADELQRFNRALRLLKKYEVTLPLDVKPLQAEQAALKKSSADLTAQLEAVQASLDELKQVRWCVRQVLPDALPTIIDGKKSVLEQLESGQRKARLSQEQQRQQAQQRKEMVTVGRGTEKPARAGDASLG